MGSVADLNGDGVNELLMDATEYYVFCYACGVRRVHFDVWRWDGETMVPVTLAPLPDSAPAQLAQINDLALTFANADLWKDALATVDAAAIVDTLDPDSEVATTFGWNATDIRLNSQAKRAAVNDGGGYPLLENVFYGDYDVAVDLMREVSADQIFTATTPLVVGTVAEGWQSELSRTLIRNSGAALEVKPGLASAHFLRGWGTYLAKPDDPTVLEDLTNAAALAPNDTLYRDSVLYLGGDLPPGSCDAAATTLATTATPVSTTLATTETLGSAPPTTPTPAQTTGRNQLTAASQVNVRSGPGTSFATLGTLAQDAAATITGRTADGEELWWQIVYPDGSDEVGWVIGNPTLVTVGEGVDAPVVEAPPLPTAAAPAAAPAGAATGSGRIFFSIQETDGAKNIYVYSFDANAPPVKAADLGIQPNLQPGGQRLAFHSTRNDMLGLGGLDLDTQLRVRFAKNIEDAYPSWNGDGNRLVFASNREGDRKWRIYVTWAATDSDIADLGFGQDPDWHPSQDRIVFKGCDNAGANCGLWLMNADGGDRQKLTGSPSDSRPVWTPDGSAVVFMSNERNGNWELYRVDVASGAVTRLTNDGANDGLPAVSADGSQVAFISDRDGSWAIWRIPANGGAAELVTATGSVPSDWLEHGLDWTP
ncbi:MAG: SH3 domain-containing protein [Caldilineaceae bacterium]|nr:SH3 domain-containing protein [Caldilineaceae bacterium]